MKNLFSFLFFLSIIFLNFASVAQTDCNPAIITNVEHENSGNRINWIMPANGEEVVISQGGDYDGGGSGFYRSSLGAYHRFIPEELATVNGGLLKQVVFAPTHASWQTAPGHTYTIQIYQGGTWGTIGERNPGTLISFQELNNDNLLFNIENTITLEIPVTIDASQELWIGYYCTNIESIPDEMKYPIGWGGGPCKDGFGNLMFLDNQWYTHSEINTYDINFCIKGKVQTLEGVTVNIYFNENNIANNISGTTYFHPNPTGEEQCYTVEVNCLEGGVSPLSNEECLTVGINENERGATFTVYPNPAKGELRIENGEWRIMNVEVYDVFGRKQKAESRRQKAESEMVINVSNLSAGIYFIKLFTEQGALVQRFIKE
jgi:hypothetical protein